MFIDALLKVAAAQAFTAAAVSTSSIDLGSPGGVGTPTKRQIQEGEPMGFLFTTDVAASATTVLLEVISADDAALTTNVTVHGSQSELSAAVVLGAAFFVPFTQGLPLLRRFIGVRVTPAGGAATVTMSAELMPDTFAQAGPPQSYARNFVS